MGICVKQFYLVFSDKRLSSFDKTIYAFLDKVAGKKKQCWPSYESILSGCSICSRNSVSLSLRKLEKFGYLRIQKHFSSSSKKRHNLYFLNSQKMEEKEFLDIEKEFSQSTS